MAKEMGRKPLSMSRPRTCEALRYEKDSDEESIPPAQFDFTERHKILQLRLQPLLQIRKDLERRLGSAAINEQTSEACDFPCHGQVVETNSRRPTEFFITSQKGWRGALERVRPSETSTKGTHKVIYDAVEVITRCGPDIKQLWADDVVQQVLAHHKMRLEHSSGFFLNDVDRIAARNYDPSDDDIVRARLRTMGVQEYYFSFGANPGITRDWLLYDVGGARSSRAAWPPYFDNINSIIFLAPISCFDQRLAEDRAVNRLEDSMTLWKLVCSSTLLAKVQMILFLNKYDILDEKLKSGVKFSKYAINYGDDKPNDASTVSKYLKQQFKSITKQFSPSQRIFYCFVTSVIDTKAMSTTLGAVYDGIIRNCLRETEFI
jgi:guanine nucleotide-binding protein subunit alpha